MKKQVKVESKTKQTAHRRIYEGLRRQISHGDLSIGEQLPSTRALAAVWETNPFTIHTALSDLAREGWVRRREGSGTFVADPRARFSRAGIYLPAEVASAPHLQFLRYLQMSLIRNLEKRGKTAEIFLDSRPAQQRSTLLRSLSEAIRQDRIHCLIAPEITATSEKSITRLTLPLATSSDIADSRRATYDLATFFHDSVQRLKAKGCRSVGLLTNVVRLPDDFGTKVYFEDFKSAVQASKLVTMGDWISNPSEPVDDLEAHGYREFNRVWRLGSRPDGLIIFPDQLVRGVVLAAFEMGKEKVTRQFRFIFHRNAHQPILCPMPATWATTDEDAMARSLIETIEKQFRREPLAPTRIPLRFSESIGI